jgi:menaquinone-dependent protoporphyrinogen oxidase
MAKVLIAYVTKSGSTGEVAKAIGEELERHGEKVDVRQAQGVEDISAYDAVILGGPLIMGWHAEALKFVRRHQGALSRVPVAYFVTSLSLTKTAEQRVGTTSLYVDPSYGEAPKVEGKLSFKEKYTTASGYLEAALKKAPQVKPVGAGFFGGKLDYSKLGFLPKLFVKVFIGAQEGDHRNWDAIHTWANNLRPALLGAQESLSTL